MKLSGLIIVLLSLSLLFGSCKMMYLPNLQNVPMFREKGELQATVALQNAQLAYAVSDQIGVIASVYNRNGKVPHLDDGNTYNYMADSYGFDFGAGFISRKDEERKVELYGGYGFGKAQLDYSYDINPMVGNGARGGSSRYNKIFIQPVFITQHKDLDFGFSVRASIVDFYDFEDKLGNQLDVERPVFLEPALTLNKRVSAFSFRGQLQFSFCAGSAGDGFGEYDPYKSKILGNIGVTVDLVKLLSGDF